MRTKLATYALAGTLGFAGVAGAAVLTPAISYAATGDSTAIGGALKTTLAGLVSDGTMTQAQADKVATVLEESRPMRGGRGGHGGFGHRGGGGGGGLAVAAETLGMTEAEIRAAGEDGKTLADLADEKGVEQDALVDAMVAAAKTRMADAVADGRLTQEQADARAADVEARITDRLDEVCVPGSGRRGPAPAADDSTA